MLTDPKLRSQVDALWDKFWTGGLSNPLDAIEQFSYLLFLKRLDDRENAAERQAKRKGTTYQPSVKKEMRWGYWTQMKAEESRIISRTVVFPNWSSWSGAKSLVCRVYEGQSVRSARQFVDRGVQSDRPDEDRGAESGCAGRSV
jgi:hypothetical protein